MHKCLVALSMVLLLATGCSASLPLTPGPTLEPADADVSHVIARQSVNGAWQFTVTVTHPDTGWDSYCDGWDVVVPAQDERTEPFVLKAEATDAYTRVLSHPHVDEQPFTRSQGGIFAPEGANVLVVRAHDSVHGWGGQEVTVDLTTSAGWAYDVFPYEGKP